MSIELPRTLTTFFPGVNLRAKEGGNFLLSIQTKPFYPRFFEPNQTFPRRLGKSGFNSTGALVEPYFHTEFYIPL